MRGGLACTRGPCTARPLSLRLSGGPRVHPSSISSSVAQQANGHASPRQRPPSGDDPQGTIGSSHGSYSRFCSDRACDGGVTHTGPARGTEEASGAAGGRPAAAAGRPTATAATAPASARQGCNSLVVGTRDEPGEPGCRWAGQQPAQPHRPSALAAARAPVPHGCCAARWLSPPRRSPASSQPQLAKPARARASTLSPGIHASQGEVRRAQSVRCGPCSIPGRLGRLVEPEATS